MKNRIRLIAAALALSMMLTLTGCMGVESSVDNLYLLPQATEDYIQLQNIIDGIISDGAEYSAPTSGNHRQSVQLEDLNGDGQSEAVAFFKENGSKPLKIYIFAMVNDAYESVAVIDGDGTAIESISYADLNGDSIKELVVGWQMSAELHMLSVYSIKDFQAVSLVLTDYTEYAVEDMDSDGSDEVYVIRSSTATSAGQVERYTLAADGEMVSTTAMLSSGIDSISRVRSGGLSDGSQGLFIEGYCNGTDIITDIFAVNDDALTNISASSSGVSTKTVRSYSVYCQDVDQDGIMDVPKPRVMAAQSDTTYYAIDWYSYSSDGNRTREFTTFHNYSDGWYFRLPQEVSRSVTVRREDSVSGQREIVFSVWDSKTQTAEDFLKIYTISNGKSGGDSRIQLYTDSSGVLYEAELLDGDLSFTLTEKEVRSSFHIIYNEWISGEI